MLLELKGQTELWSPCPDAFRMCCPQRRTKSSLREGTRRPRALMTAGTEAHFLDVPGGSGKVADTTFRGRAGARGTREKYCRSRY